MQECIVFLLRVQCRRKESSRSLSHLLMSFLYVSVEIHFDLIFTLVLCFFTKKHRTNVKKHQTQKLLVFFGAYYGM